MADNGKLKKMYNVGIYCRLSNEDSRAGESTSIENQKLMMTRYAYDRGWIIKEIYQDDGFTGTNQKRPAFQRMMKDVKAGFINTILIKDLSRLGRNYLEVGNLAEVFLPEYDCELISLNEPMDDMMVFRNWFNEQHSKTTSIKVKAAKRTVALSGKYQTAIPPYGYIKDPNNYRQLLIDTNTAHIIQKIFQLRADGIGYRGIAIKLNKEGMKTPRDYYYEQKNSEPKNNNKYWNYITIRKILNNETYIGNVVYGKTATKSYKDKKILNTPYDEWIRKENMHEPIISKELWEKAHRFKRKNYRTKTTKNGTRHLFSGIIKCADCGSNMRSKGVKTGAYVCDYYGRCGAIACSSHYIQEKYLIEAVISKVQEHAKKAHHDEAYVIKSLAEKMKHNKQVEQSVFKKDHEEHKRNLSKIDALINQLYNDRVAGLVPDTVFARQIRKLETDRETSEAAIIELETKLREIKSNTDHVKQWTKQIKKYRNLEILDSEILHTLIDVIYIGQTQKIINEDGKVQKIRDIRIVFNYENNTAHV